MPSIAQWTGNVFWGQIQWVAARGRAQKARLDQQRLDLQHAYTAARNSGDQEKMTALTPLIHRNSELRLRWDDLRRGFNDVVEKARTLLAQHGISEPPTLAGLGQLQVVIVPALWVVALLAVVAIIHEIDAGINAVGEGLRKIGPVGATALALAPLLLIAAAIYLVPMFMRGRAAA
jgi:hypothetical protein